MLFCFNYTNNFVLQLKTVTFVKKKLKVSTKEKLIERFKRQPKDFTFEELVRLFQIFGFTIDNKGKTSGSRIVFLNEDKMFGIHKPHPSNIIKEYVMKEVFQFFVSNGFFNQED
jgi:hypothetical protein